MAYSWSEEVVSSGTTLIPVDIEYLDKSYIYLYINNVLVPSSDYVWNSDTVIQLNNPLAATSTVLLVRRTDKEYLYIMFAEGAAFIRENLDTQNTQFLHLAQELVEGRSIEGFYGDLSMNGYRITDLGAGVDPGDAVNKAQLDVVDQRVANIEASFVTSTTSYPWFELTVAESKDTFSPEFTFDKAAVYINGACQTPEYSYVVVDNKILLAEPVPAGTMVFARLGEDVSDADGYATVQQMLNFIEQFNTELASKAAKGANSDITSLSGLTTPLSTAQGGTGNNTGKAPTAGHADTADSADTANTAGSAATAGSAGTAASADTATKLTTARTIRTNLASTSTASFDGTANATPGVTGTLPVANGGTGSTTAATARNALGVAASGANGDITSLTGLTTPLSVAQGGTGGNTAALARAALDAAANTGVTNASEAAAGKLGEFLSAKTATPVALTSGSTVNLIQLTLTPGDWEVDGAVFVNLTGASLTTAVAGTGLTSATIDAFPNRTQLAINFVGNVQFPIPRRRINVSASTVVYLPLLTSFSGGSATGEGFLQARRCR